MNQVWIIEKGEDHQGGNIIGVYTDRDLARADFTKAAREIDATFGIDSAEADVTDGTISVHGGCDWLTLAPYDVNNRLAIEK